MELKITGFENLSDSQEQEFKQIVFKIAESITDIVQSFEDYEEELENFELLSENDSEVQGLIDWKRIHRNQNKTNFPN
ncbi:MAG: hypothetical protein AAGG68_12945 [Bacteroidota bacterium]